MADKKYLIALDAGGTMTDTFAVDKDGNFILGKSLTNHEDESRSYVESVGDAAGYWGMSSAELHAQAISATYTGTTMLNALLTQKGSNVGLLITRGFAHLPIIERGLTWIGQSYEDILHQQLHEHTPWLVQPKNIKEVTERINVGSYYMEHHSFPGTPIIPIVEEEVRKGVEELVDNNVEIIGILFLGSYTNPMHEARAADIAREIVAQRGRAIPVFTSSEICPVTNETERLKTLLIQCYIAEIGKAQLLKVEEAAKKDGYEYGLLTLLSYGAAASVRYPKLCEAIVSGPVGGLLGGQYLSSFLKSEGIICADLGGTTFDVGLIVRDLLPVTKSTDFAGHRLRLPMVSVDSIGAGTGTAIHVDENTKRITLGPESAGSKVGTCYEYPDITIGDIDLILGYLSEDYFLGGKVRLNKEKALQMLKERLAKPLGQDIYEVSSKVLDLLHSRMCDHINQMLLSRGLNPAEFTMLIYGGSGPLHAWGLERGLDIGNVLMVPWAAAFSAFGVAAADYFHRYDKAVTFFLTPEMPDEVKLMMGGGLSMTWQELEEKGYAELEAEGIPRDQVNFRHGISCRYIGQLSEWEVPVETGRAGNIDDLNKIIGAFEKHYTRIYPSGARYPQAGYQITEIYLEAVAKKTKPMIHAYPLQGQDPPNKASKGSRQVYMDSEWQEFAVWEMDLLQVGNRIDGPAIIEHPMTTLVVPPQNYVEIDQYKFMHYRRK